MTWLALLGIPLLVLAIAVPANEEGKRMADEREHQNWKRR